MKLILLPLLLPPASRQPDRNALHKQLNTTVLTLLVYSR